MTDRLARTILSLAALSLGDSRRDWARAMQGELEAASEDGKGLAFATGCLIAAWREMPVQAEGRFVLATYAFAVGLLLPVAALQFGCAAGYSYAGQAGSFGMLAQGSVHQPYLATAYLAAIPSLLALWALLGIGHIRLAWAMLDQDWPRVVRIGTANVAMSATLMIFTVVLFLGDTGAGLQAAALAVELAAIHGFARWHARISSNALSEALA